jgi:acyl carrier protein
MNPDDSRQLVKELKALVLDATEKPEPADGLMDHELLFGRGSRLGLDSLDALQVSMALQQRFGVRIGDSKETRRALSTIANLAAYLQTRQA